MNMRALIPWSRERSSSIPSAYRNEEVSPFLALHREMNRLFDDVFSRFDSTMPPFFNRLPAWPSVEVVETDKDVRIAAELPGMDENDVEISVTDDVLTIRGEKKAEIDDRGRHFSERYYGRFERVIPLPFEVEDDRAEASFENGVLTVTLPKRRHYESIHRPAPLLRRNRQARSALGSPVRAEPGFRAPATRRRGA
jgi:HSP20 family protein